MRIEIDKLTTKQSVFANKYESEELALEDEDVRLVQTLEISGVVNRSDSRVNLTGKIKTGVEVLCDRCLTPVFIDIDNEFDVDLAESSIYDAAQSLELKEDDLNLSVLDSNVIDIDDFAREQLYLALPSRVVCKNDCLGLCEKCGANKNIKSCQCQAREIDPRWAGLKDLLK